MKGYQKMTSKDFFNVPLYIPIDILSSYSLEQLRRINKRGTKIYLVLQDNTLKEYVFSKLPLEDFYPCGSFHLGTVDFKLIARVITKNEYDNSKAIRPFIFSNLVCSQEKGKIENTNYTYFLNHDKFTDSCSII